MNYSLVCTMAKTLMIQGHLSGERLQIKDIKKKKQRKFRKRISGFIQETPDIHYIYKTFAGDSL